MATKKENIDDQIRQEAGLEGSDWHVVEDAEPIQPSRTPAGGPPTNLNKRGSYYGGVISEDLQRPANFENTGVQSPNIPVLPLMPISVAGKPSNNSQTVSTTTTPIFQAIQPVQQQVNNLTKQFNNAGFQGAWSPSLFYQVSAQVTEAGQYWTAIAANIDKQPSISPSFWQQLSASSFYEGTWSSLTSYLVGEQVSYQGNFYISIKAPNLNQTPAIDNSSIYWTLLGTSAVLIGAWSSSTAYVPGNQVSFNGNFYQCVSANTNVSPLGNPSFWTPITNAYNFTGVCASAGSSQWYKVGTVVFGNIAETVNFQFLSGRGFNSNVNQQTTTFISMRTSNNTVAPNLSGVTWYENGGVGPGNAAVLAVKAVATGGSTSITNLSWDLYIEVSSFCSGTLIVNAGPDCSFTLSNTTASDPGAASSTVVVGIGGYGLGGVNNGTSNFSATASGLTYRPLTNPLTAHDAGANATINIAAFTMRTSGNGDISILSGSVTALSYSTLYFCYYDDPTLAGGTVPFQATTTKTTAINGSGRFFVGSIKTPAATAPDTTGNNDGGVGAQSGNTAVFLFGTATGAATNQINEIDGNLTTFSSLSVGTTGAGTINDRSTMAAASPTSATWTSLTLYTLTSVQKNTDTGTGFCAVDYSLDAGTTFTNIFTVTIAVGNRALTLDSVALPLSQNLALLQVRVTASHTGVTGDGSQNINTYEAWVVGIT